MQKWAMKRTHSRSWPAEAASKHDTRARTRSAAAALDFFFSVCGKQGEITRNIGDILQACRRAAGEGTGACLRMQRRCRAPFFQSRCCPLIILAEMSVTRMMMEWVDMMMEYHFIAMRSGPGATSSTVLQRSPVVSPRARERSLRASGAASPSPLEFPRISERKAGHENTSILKNLSKIAEKCFRSHELVFQTHPYRITSQQCHGRTFSHLRIFRRDVRGHVTNSLQVKMAH